VVTDNAGGIDPALISKLSEPYYTTKEHGTLNGLYLAKIFIEKMNGFIKVQNTEDGSRFILSVRKSLF
jgi:signal transduction histidine kinase